MNTKPIGKKTKNKDGEGDLLWLQTTNNLVAESTEVFCPSCCCCCDNYKWKLKYIMNALYQARHNLMLVVGSLEKIHWSYIRC